MDGTDLEKRMRLLMAKIECDIMYELTEADAYCKWLLLPKGLLQHILRSFDHNLCWVYILFGVVASRLEYRYNIFAQLHYGICTSALGFLVFSTAKKQHSPFITLFCHKTCMMHDYDTLDRDSL